MLPIFWGYGILVLNSRECSKMDNQNLQEQYALLERERQEDKRKTVIIIILCILIILITLLGLYFSYYKI